MISWPYSNDKDGSDSDLLIYLSVEERNSNSSLFIFSICQQCELKIAILYII